jgi:acyl-coenzyme A synthetase/AMP-(fatty) acid ligase
VPVVLNYRLSPPQWAAILADAQPRPRSVDFVEALPRTPTGKVLKRVLREPYWSGQSRRVAGV